MAKNKPPEELFQIVLNSYSTCLVRLMDRMEEYSPNFLSGKLKEISDSLQQLEDNKKFWAIIHSKEWIRKFRLHGLAADFCSKLPWTFWRYPYGLEEPEKYSRKPAANLEDQPKLSL